MLLAPRRMPLARLLKALLMRPPVLLTPLPGPLLMLPTLRALLSRAPVKPCRTLVTRRRSPD
jgi:hypothetical protein